MQTNFQVQWVPLPAEREGEWRHAIELIAEIIKEYAKTMSLELTQNQYRFAWLVPGDSETHYGSFLFSAPAEARDTEVAMKKTFGEYIIWLEDREHNRVDIPR